MTFEAATFAPAALTNSVVSILSSRATAKGLRIVAETLEPGGSVQQVAARHDLYPGLLFTWRRRERAVNDVGKTVNIVPVRVVEATPTATAAAPASMGRMEIVLVGGERILVGADVDATALARIIKALTRR